MQPSKSVSKESTSAPLAIGCTSWAIDILPLGKSTIEGMPAAAQYTANAAEVSPVEAQATAWIGAPSLIICFTCDTSTVIPRSLKDPLWELPQSLIQRLSRPIILPNRSAQNRLVPPSYSETIF